MSKVKLNLYNIGLSKGRAPTLVSPSLLLNIEGWIYSGQKYLEGLTI